MPTLIRLIVALLFLAGVGYAGLFALAVLVQPGQKQVTVRIPASTFADIEPVREPANLDLPPDSGQPPSITRSEETAPE